MAENIREIARQSRIQNIDKNWLRNRITVEEAEAKHLVDFSLGDDTSEAAQRLRAGRLKLARDLGGCLGQQTGSFRVCESSMARIACCDAGWGRIVGV